MIPKRKFRGSDMITDAKGISFMPSGWNGVPCAVLWCRSDLHQQMNENETGLRSKLSLYSWRFQREEAVEGTLCAEFDLAGIPIKCEWIKRELWDSGKIKSRGKSKENQTDAGHNCADGIAIIPTDARVVYIINASEQSMISKIDLEHYISDLCLGSSNGVLNLWIAPKDVNNTLFMVNAHTGAVTESLKIQKTPVKIASFLGGAPGATPMLATVGGKISIYDLKSKALVKELSGHTSESTQLEFTPNGKHILGTFKDDNSIYIWCVPCNSNFNPICILSACAPLISFCLNMHSTITPEVSFHIAVASIGKDGAVYAWNEENVALLYNQDPCKSEADPIPPNVVRYSHSVSPPARRSGHKLSQQEFNSVSFFEDHLIALSTWDCRPIFSKIMYLDERSRIVISDMLLPAVPEKSDSTRPTNPANEPDLLNPVDLMVHTKKMKDMRTTLAHGAPLYVNGASALVNGVPKTKLSRKSLDDASPCEVDSRSTLTEVTVLHALTQAVLKNDEKLVLRYVCSVKKQFVSATIKKLEPKVALSLFTILLSILRGAPSKYAVTVRWLRELMFFHASYLASIPDVEIYLGKLQSILQTRAGLMDKLLSLSARLDVMALNIRASNAAAVNADDVQKPADSALVSISEIDLCGSTDDESHSSSPYHSDTGSNCS